MSTSLLRITGALLASVAFVSAQGPAGEPATEAPADPAKTESVPPYQLKNRSTFTVAPEISRAPFWPIGWVKRIVGAPVQAQEAAPVAKVLLDEKSFKVTSILLGTGTTPSLAVINGRAYSEGEFLRMPKGTMAAGVKVRVQRINDGQVVLQNADQVVVAPLQRPELSTKRAEEPLLDPDR